jgi:hypothetical protein
MQRVSGDRRSSGPRRAARYHPALLRGAQAFSDPFEQAADLFQRAMRLSPHERSSFYFRALGL